MQILIQTAPFKVSAETISRVTEKMTQLQKIYERIERCSVMLKKEKSDIRESYVVEVHLAVPGHDLFAAEAAESYGRALLNVVDDLKKQLLRHKQKMNEIQASP